MKSGNSTRMPPRSAGSLGRVPRGSVPHTTAWLADNLHPNDAGYVALGQSFYGVIGAFSPAAP
jgi:lysophospholipase L1-like esterase